MKILLLGNGGREHAMAWKIAQSPLCTQLFIAPGNGGTGQHGINLPDIRPTDFEAVADFCLSAKVELVVVGPEEPLVKGVVDHFRSHHLLAHLPVIGPAAYGAQLEGSKAFAKKFMQRHGIPTAAHREFAADDLEVGLHYLQRQTPPIVLKADGLAAGKGVLILQSVEEAKTELMAMLHGKFGEASSTVVVEEYLSGREFSVFVLTDGTDYKILPVAKDYKRVGEGDTGLNTGGMGAVSPPPFVDAEMMRKVEALIIQPTVAGLASEKIDYKGFIFFGLIEVDGEPYVIEYNCRLGDPETEVVLPRLRNDLVELLLATADGRLRHVTIEEEPQAATTIFLVSGGYPGNYATGKPIANLARVVGSTVFHAGTRTAGQEVLTNGGRVLAVTSLGENFRQALEVSNRNARLIDFEGKYFRCDIGFDL